MVFGSKTAGDRAMSVQNLIDRGGKRIEDRPAAPNMRCKQSIGDQLRRGRFEK
jgi:hypothetical protein